MISQNKKYFSDSLNKIDRNLPLEKFIPAAFIIFLLCIIILSIITYQNIERYKENVDQICQSNELIKQLDEINFKIEESSFLRNDIYFKSDESGLTRIELLTNDVKKEYLRKGGIRD
ncbi:MAG TPA: hypothetical protein PKD83_12040 [Ignavibacteria bacterium]|nr:hypothetical protein [Ignavibacteria bacterium]